MKARKILAILLALMMLVLSACGGSSGSSSGSSAPASSGSSAPASSGSSSGSAAATAAKVTAQEYDAVAAVSLDFTTMDPVDTSDTLSGGIQRLIMDGLFGFDDDMNQKEKGCEAPQAVTFQNIPAQLHHRERRSNRRLRSNR